MIRHRCDIEGLRAVAVIPVILFHFGFGCSGGFVGVDIFFVISGFLITSLLLKDHHGDGISLPEFWERRVRRIWPALTVTLVFAFVGAWWLFLPEDFKRFGRTLVAQVYFGSNFYFTRHTGYFEPVAELQPLLHTWSLAVEEQFYLFFPLLMVALRKFRLPLAPVFATIAVISFALSIWLTPTHPAGSFYLLHTRAWELLIGALLATVSAQRVRGIASEFLTAGGLTLIAFAIFFYDSRTPFPGAFALIPCLGAAFVIQGQDAGETFASRILCLPPLTWVGRLSYSLYLWHWPLLVLGRYWKFEPLSLQIRVGLLAATFVLSWLSWRYVETPFRKRGVFPQRKRLFALAVACAIVLIIVGVLVSELRGIPSRFPERVLHFANAAGESRLPHHREMALADAEAGKFMHLGTHSENALPQFLLWGDSHAMAVIPVFDRIAGEQGMRGFAATHSSTAPLLNFYCVRPSNFGSQCIQFNGAIFEKSRGANIKNVILVASWHSYLSDAFIGDHGPLYGEEARHAFETAIIQTVESLEKIGCNVWLMLEAPDQQVDVPKRLARAALRGENIGAIGRPTADYVSEVTGMRALFVKSGARILDPANGLARDGICRAELNGEALYRDNQHLTVSGAMQLRPMVEAVFLEIARRK